MRTPEDVLRSLVADIEAMQHPRPTYELGYEDDNTSDCQPKNFFGPFDNYMDEGEGCMVSGARVTVEWPNLRILLNEAMQVLDAQKPAGA